MADHKQSIIDAIKASDAPNDAKVIGYALTHLVTGMCNDIRRIADMLERQPDPVGSSGKVVGNISKWESRIGRFDPIGWRTWDGSAVRPLHLPDTTTIRVQFRSKPDHVETYRLDSSEIDWTDVIAYQIIKSTE